MSDCFFLGEGTFQGGGGVKFSKILREVAQKGKGGGGFERLSNFFS